MKKYLCMAAAGMLLFSACSNEDDVINSGNSSADFEGQELVMKVVNTGDGLTTRAVRPLLSSEAGQKIDKVKLAIFKLNNQNAVESCVFAKTFTDWQNDSKDYGGSTTNGTVDHGKYASLNLKKEINPSEENKGLEPGKYMVYAVGYNSDQSVYKYNPTLDAIVENWNGAVDFESIKATTEKNAEEIFAGSIAEITVDDSRNFTIVDGKADNNILYLHRQVAGAFGYFKNIPAKGFDGTEATHLRLVAVDKNKTVNMTKFNTNFRVETKNVMYVVNGETPADADAKFKGSDSADGYVVYNIKLTDWFTQGDSNSDGVLGKGDNWAIPTDLQDKFKALDGTVFGGNFVIPFANKNKTTFELQLVNGEGVDATILRTWSINLENAQSGVVGLKNDTEIPNESVSSYSIVRNHLYTIGEKDIANPETDPETPEPGEQPEDLSKGQILTLRVNDNWETVENLVVEPEI